MTSDLDDRRGISRRKILECMTWAGTGVLWTIAGGMPRSMGIIGEATAAEPSGLTFLQISDSHVGFDKPANPNALGKDWFDVKEGEASIFMPEGGKYRLVGRVPMEDWLKLAVTAN